MHPKPSLMTLANRMMARLERVLFAWLILSLPFLLLSGAILLLMTRASLTLAYARRDLPPDRYGWTNEQRFKLALPSYAFLQSTREPDQAADLLRVQKDPVNGETLFTEREIRHMIDVKAVLDSVRQLCFTLIVLWFVSCVVLDRRLSAYSPWRAMRYGAACTLFVVIGGAMMLSLLPWSTVFRGMHGLFFDSGSWIFPQTASLIRLFPSQFWVHHAAALVFLTVAEAVILLTVALYTIPRYEQRRTRKGF